MKTTISAIQAVHRLASSYSEVREQLIRQMDDLDHREHEDMERLLRGEETGPAPVVTFVQRRRISSQGAEWVARGGRPAMPLAPSQLGGACATAAEDINPLAGGFIVVLPDTSMENNR